VGIFFTSTPGVGANTPHSQKNWGGNPKFVEKIKGFIWENPQPPCGEFGKFLRGGENFYKAAPPPPFLLTPPVKNLGKRGKIGGAPPHPKGSFLIKRGKPPPL